MTIPINTFQDILDALEREPSLRDELRRHLLGDDLLQLPALFAQHVAEFAEFVRLTTEQNELTNRRLENLETAVTDLKAGQARLETDVAELKAGQAKLENTVGTLVSDVAELKTGQARLEDTVGTLVSDVAELKTGQAKLETTVGRLEDTTGTLVSDMAELKDTTGTLVSDMAELKGTVGTLGSDMTELKSTVGTMGGTVSHLAGKDYEAHAARVGPRRLRSHLNLERAWAVTHPPHGDPSFLTELAYQSEINGIITPEQAADLEYGDLVFTSTNEDGRQCYILAEISLTVQQTDVERAARRAAILQHVTGIPTTPITIGESIAPNAEGDTVTFIAIPNPPPKR